MILSNVIITPFEWGILVFIIGQLIGGIKIIILLLSRVKILETKNVDLLSDISKLEKKQHEENKRVSEMAQGLRVAETEISNLKQRLNETK